MFKLKSNSHMCVLFHTYAHGLLKQPCDTQYLNATEFAVHVPRSHASHSCILCLCIAVQTAGCYRNNYTSTVGLNSACCALADHVIHHKGLCCGDRQRAPATMVLLTVLIWWNLVGPTHAVVIKSDHVLLDEAKAFTLQSCSCALSSNLQLILTFQ